jgi:hypothetical protein
VFGDAPAAAAKSALGSRNARVGDRIAATVHKEARWKGGVIVPASRIRSIEKPADGNFTLAMEFAELQNGESQGFFARLTEVTSASGDRRMKDEGLPGVATLQLRRRLPPFAQASSDLENGRPLTSTQDFDPFPPRLIESMNA